MDKFLDSYRVKSTVNHNFDAIENFSGYTCLRLHVTTIVFVAVLLRKHIPWLFAVCWLICFVTIHILVIWNIYFAYAKFNSGRTKLNQERTKLFLGRTKLNQERVKLKYGRTKFDFAGIESIFACAKFDCIPAKFKLKPANSLF